MEQKEINQEKKSWYDRWYKILLAIPVVIMLISLIYLGVFYLL